MLSGTIVGNALGVPKATPKGTANADAPASGSRKRAGNDTANLYVILLRDAVWLDHRRLRERNPDYRPNMPCVYVGVSWHEPEKRFEQHMAGRKYYSRIVRKYGVRLLPDLYKDRNPVPKAEREEQEERLALDLQKRGYAAWWN